MILELLVARFLRASPILAAGGSVHARWFTADGDLAALQLANLTAPQHHGDGAGIRSDRGRGNAPFGLQVLCGRPRGVNVDAENFPRLGMFVGHLPFVQWRSVRTERC